MSEVKPDTPKLCPWCNESPKVSPERPEIEGNCWGRVKCVNPACPVKPSVRDDETVSDDRGSDAYKARAIELWNMVEPSAKLAAAEARVRELEAEDEKVLAVLPEDWGAVEYIKYLEGEQNRIPDLVHENEVLASDKAELTRKGEELCNALGPAYLEIHELRRKRDALTAANAAVEEKLAEAHAWVSPLDKPMPVMKPMLVALLVHNTETGAQWTEQFPCFLHDEDYGLCDLADGDPLPWEPDSILLYHLLPGVDDAALEREASRKKGAEHGE